MTSRLAIFLLCSPSRLGFLLAIILIIAPNSAKACLPETYKQLNTHCIETSRFDALLNVVFGNEAHPRQIAVVAGVSKYPALPERLQLPPAANDIEMLDELFIHRLGFDEVITLQDKDFSLANLYFVFSNYLPDLLQASPGSRVVFAFSGHGSDFDNQGFLYFGSTKTITASSYAELIDALNLTTLKVIMAPTMHSAQQFLALINACNGGYFLDVGAQFGGGSLEEKGAHGITAGGAKDAVHSYPNVGTGKGSVFFEMVSAALRGQDVTVGGRKIANPSKDDGIITSTRLADFLATTISIIENYSLSPRMGALTGRSPGNQGEFFFIVDYSLAKEALSRRFQKNAERVFGSPATERAPGLYAQTDIPQGTLLRRDMFILTERRNAEGDSYPSSFSEHVSGACLEHPLIKGERLTWQHLRGGCK